LHLERSDGLKAILKQAIEKTLENIFFEKGHLTQPSLEAIVGARD
jgi:hypothetical protein